MLGFSEILRTLIRHLPQARFWVASGLPTIRELSRGWLEWKCRVLPLAVRLGDGKCQSLRGLRGFPFCVEKESFSHAPSS
jgi:hypothetical protein